VDAVSGLHPLPLCFGPRWGLCFPYPLAAIFSFTYVEKRPSMALPAGQMDTTLLTI